MLCVDSSRLCMSGLSLCDLCLCYSIFRSHFSNKYLLTYFILGIRVPGFLQQVAAAVATVILVFCYFYDLLCSSVG